MEKFKPMLAGGAILTAIGGASVALLNMANDADKAFDRMQVNTGATNAEMVDMKKTALDVFSSGLGEGLDDAAKGVTVIKSAFRDLDNNTIAKLTKGTLTLKEGFDSSPEIKETAKAIKTMTANFNGLSATDALDLITTGFQKNADYADDFIDTVNEYSSYFDKLGVGAEQFIGTLIKGGKAGAFNLDKVGDAFKEIGIRAIDGSETTKDAFKSLGFDAKDMGSKFSQGGQTAKSALMATVSAISFVKDATERNRIGVELFGTQWEDLRERVIYSIDGAEDAVTGFHGATDRAQEQLQDNFGSKWTTFWRTVKGDVIESMDESGVSVNGFMDVMLSKLPAIKTAIGEVVSDLKVMAQLVSGNVDGAVSTTREKTRDNLFENPLYVKQILGENIGGGIAEGLKSKTQSVADATMSMSKKIESTIVDFFDIRSPSRLMQEKGEYIAAGMGKGIMNGSGGAVDAAQSMSDGIVSASGGGSSTGQTGASYGQGSGAIHMPITVQLTIPAGMGAGEAQKIGGVVGEEVQSIVNKSLVSVFSQLGIKFAN
jgi:hypothetical protein